MAKRRVRGQRLQQRQMASQTVEDPDRRLGVRHPDVDMQSSHRRCNRVPEQLADALIALLIGDLRLTLDRRRMRPRSQQPRPRLQNRPAQTAERTDRLASAATDVGDQLNQASMQLALDRSVNRAKPLLYRRRRVRLMAAHRINQEQLLLNADRERLSRAERVAELIVRTQVSTLPVTSAGER